MKKIFLLLTAFASLQAAAQIQNIVGFAVQIPSGTVVDSVDVTGDWVNAAGLGANWSNAKKLTNVSGTYAGTANIPNGTYFYKFRTWSGGTVTWEAPPSTCSIAPDNNRQLVVNGNTSAGPFCISTCNAACAPASVNVNLVFRVDVTGLDRTIPAGCTNTDMINVTGDFGVDAGSTNWTPGSLPMTELGLGTKIFEKTVTVKNKGYAYKFLRANAWDYTDANGVKTQFSEQKDSFATPAPCLSGNDRFIDLSAASAGSTTIVYYKWQTCNVGKPLAISNIANKNNSFSIAPNPSNGEVKITLDAATVASVQIVNQMGQTIYATQAIANKQLVVNNLAKGFYTVIARNKAGEASSQKLIVE